MIDPMASASPVITDVPTGRRPLIILLLRDPLALASMIFLAIIIAGAIFAPLLTPFDPTQASLQDVLLAPGGDHPLGTDTAGRDVLSRLLYAGRYSLAGSAVTLLIAMAIGVTGGLIAGYFGRWFDSVSSWLTGMLMALPPIIVLLAARTVAGPSIWISMAVLGVLISPAFFRLVYSSVRSVRGELYVDAARISGLSDARIISRHILTVVRAPVVIQAAVVAGIAIGVQAGLEFLGFGDIAIPTWGTMLNEGFGKIYTNPTLVVWPSMIIALTCISLVLLANAMRDALEGSSSSSVTRRKKLRAPDSTSSQQPRGNATIVHEDDAVSDIGEVLLRVTNLEVGYGRDDGSFVSVVSDVSLTVHRGEVHGLIGESGSGKTQTAWSILRLLPEGGTISGGTIDFEGRDLADASEREMTAIRGRKIGYIPQEPMSNLDPSYTIGSQLVEPMRVCLGLSKKDAKVRALHLLDRVGIPDPARTYAAYPHEISGGMAQRALIARAVSCEPDLLIADEPTTALDVTVQAEVLDLLRSLQKELGMGMVLVTHNFGVVADICDHVSVMKSGRIVESGSVEAIFAAPEHEYTKSLFAAILDETEPREDFVPATEVSLS